MDPNAESACDSLPTTASVELRGIFVQPIARFVQQWVAQGKLDEDDLDRALGADARAFVDHSIAGKDWASFESVEELVDLAASQLGGEAGLVEWADEIAADLMGEEAIERILGAGRTLVDGPGFVVSQSSDELLRASDWRYEGGVDAFSVRWHGLGALSPALKSLLGACFARLAAAADARPLDVRFEGVDEAELLVFGELESADPSSATSRLHRAALIP